MCTLVCNVYVYPALAYGFSSLLHSLEHRRHKVSSLYLARRLLLLVQLSDIRLPRDRTHYLYYRVYSQAVRIRQARSSLPLKAVDQGYEYFARRDSY